MTEDYLTVSTYNDHLRKCRECRQFKVLSEFGICQSVGRKNRRRWSCRTCRAARESAWKKANPEKSKAKGRAISLRDKYGLTVDEYERIAASQGGVCAICRKPETRIIRQGTPPRLSVDHDHTTGRVRQLLCNSCNNILGLANDNPALLRAAICYLGRHTKEIADEQNLS